MINKKKLQKHISLLLVFVIINNVLLPFTSYALTTGPHQQEYLEYEDIGSTDLVNLLNGDFTMNIPILHVPSPEGGFSVPLSYHSGIKPNQEASWVGLGWGLNVGSISRTVNQFPDELSSHNAITFKGDNTYSQTDRRYGPFVNASWNSIEGHSGEFNFLNLVKGTWGKGKNTSEVVGINWDDDGFKNVDVKDLVFGALSIAAYIATGGGASAAGLSAGQAVGIQLSADVFMQAGMAAVSSGGSSGVVYDPSMHVSYTNNSLFPLFHDVTHTSVWIDKTTKQHGYGIAASSYNGNPIKYYNKISASSKGSNISLLKFNGDQDYYSSSGNDDNQAGSDIHMQIDNGSYCNSFNPVNIAYDNFQVMGDGISGTMQPYHTTIGSVCYPSWTKDVLERVSITPFKEAQFKYIGDFSNSYLYHDGKYSGGEDFGLECSYSSASNTMQLELKNNNLYQKKNEDNRYGLVNNKLIKGKNIVHNKDSNTFKITREDGRTYYYEKKVNNKNSTTKIFDRNNYFKLNTSILNTTPYPTSWLLTGITGSDYCDVGEIGIDLNDKGYFVKFEYGKFSENYKWRNPYRGYNHSSANDALDVYSEGKKQTFYLNKIITRTHTALFVKEIRKDGRSFYNYNSDTVSSSLKLNEIILLHNSDYDKLESVYNFKLTPHNTNFDSYNEIIDVADFGSPTGSVRQFLNSVQLQKTVFNYSYALCNNTANSFENASNPPQGSNEGEYILTGSGKLTLNSFSVFGKDNLKLFPDYVFDYKASENNPNYNPNNIDGWGTYKTGGSNTMTGRYASTVATDGIGWNLRKISTPMGNIIEVDYERDSYSQICGVDISTGAKYGGDVRVSQIKVTDGSNVLSTTKYLYGLTKGNLPNNNGMVSKEPDYIKTGTDPEHYKLYDFPFTGVIYGKVTVLNGKFENGNQSDYIDKKEYEFEMPKEKMVELLRTDKVVRQDWVHGSKLVNYSVLVNTASIGAIKSITVFDKTAQTQKHIFNYQQNYYGPNGSSPDVQGVYTQGTLLSEFVQPTPEADQTWRTIKTTKYYSSNVLKSITSYNGSAKSIVANKGFDFITGRVLDKEYSNSFGITYRGIDVPAYFIYDEMGSKVTNNSNSNMLSQNAAEYLFKKGATSNQVTGSFKVRAANTFNSYYEITLNNNAKLPLNYGGGFGPEIEILNGSGDYLPYKVINVSKDRTSFTILSNINIYSTSPITIKLYTWPLISSSIQTWKKFWRFRLWNDPMPYDEPTTTSGVWKLNKFRNEFPNKYFKWDSWKKDANYVWNSPYLSNDGTYDMNKFKEFNWIENGYNETFWLKSNQVNLYNPFSYPLEIFDVNKNIVSTRFNHYNTKIICQTTYSNLTSATYSGFEEVKDYNNIPYSSFLKYFEGEFNKGELRRDIRTINSDVPSDIKAHTGNSIAIIPGNGGISIGPSYSAQHVPNSADGTNLMIGQKYRASVWIHEKSHPNTKLVYKITGETLATSSYSATSSASIKDAVVTVNGWKLVNLDFTIPADYKSCATGDCTKDLKIYVENSNSNSAAYIDDIRVHPFVANMSCTITDDKTSLKTFDLDRDNYYTKYEYDSRNRLISVYKESSKGVFKVKEYNYNVKGL